MLRDLRPFFISNSRVPGWLSRVAPIRISAITIGPVVFCRGEPSPRTKRHETIHFQQYLETAFIGFLLVYAYDYIRELLRGNRGRPAYLALRAEVEAHQYDESFSYLTKRVRWRWLRR
jgi:hypothetical protein